MTEFYETSYANVHRGVYELGERATEALESAREKVRAFVNAPSEREIIFVRNATEALNLVAYAYGLDNLGPGDLVLASELEHHSNFVPWQAMARRTGADFELIPVGEGGELRLDVLELFADRRVKVVAAGLVSNALGTVNDVPALADWAHARGAILVVDATQAAPHRPIDVRGLGADFIAVSGHKMCGPSGIGFLWGRGELLRSMSPFLYGGHMIRHVGDHETTYGELPAKFEAGTAPMAEAVGLGAAVDYLEAVGLEAIEAHEQTIVAYALEQLGAIPGVSVYGPPAEQRAGIVSFNVETAAGVEVHPHDVAQVLDLDAIAVRAGHHCCQPLMRRLGVLATTRASFYLYNDLDDVDRLADGVRRVQETFA
jgi:cysteine desulfurase/selenocysteine lyase